MVSQEEIKATPVSGKKDVQATSSTKETPAQTCSAAVPEGLKDHGTIAIIEAAAQDLSQELGIVVSSSANLINSRSCFGGEG